MKDYLGYSQWINKPVKNFFTTAYARFQKMPFAELHSIYNDEWLKFKDRLKKYDVLGE